MNLLELPNEILVMIFLLLDLKTKLSVATTCERLATIMCRSELIGRVSFSHTTFAVQILQRETFRILAPHIRDLDLCHVGNLNKIWLVPTLELMRNLRILDLSLTNITLLDLAGVCELCPHLTRLSVDYSRPDCGELENIEALKRSFRRLEHVHLFGGLKAFQSLDVIRLLQDSNLQDLKFTTVDSVYKYDTNHEHYDSTFGEFPFKIFSACINETFNIPFYSIPIVEGLCKCGWDYILINNSEIAVSRAFAKSNEGNSFQPHVSNDLDDFKINGNVYLFMWHPDVVLHNTDFRKKILNLLNRRTPKFLCCSSPVKSIDDSHIYVSPNHFTEYVVRYPDDKILYKSPEYWSHMNIDHLSKFGDDLKLSFVRMSCHIFPHIYHPLTLSGTDTHIYRNITYLYFDPDLEQYLSTDFLSDLFKNCPRLETLFFDNDVQLLENSLIYSKSLKNLMVYNPITDPLPFVQAVAKCRTLENIHICDISLRDETGHMKHFTEGLSELVESCKQLHSLEYRAVWRKRSRKIQMSSIIKVLKETGRDIRCELSFHDHKKSQYKCRIMINPFCRVFLAQDWFKLLSRERLNFK